LELIVAEELKPEKLDIRLPWGDVGKKFVVGVKFKHF